MDALFEGPLPDEREATCSDCAMCVSDDAPAHPDALAFDAHSKCCTYLPELMNFLVGRVLSDDSAEGAPGRATVEARLDAGIAVSPLGLGVPRPYALLYAHAVAHDGFGRTGSLRCPHYLDADGGKCGIWQHRMSVCTTWFCKYVRGARGKRFWQEGLRPLLEEVERTVARHCLLELDVGPAALAQLFPPPRPASGEDVSQGSQLQREPERYRKSWGRWAGREREFYLAAWRLVERMPWADVVAVGGPALRARVLLAVEGYRAVRSKALPVRPYFAGLHIVHSTADYARVWAYSPYDPLALPTPMLGLLHRFNGRPARVVMEELAREEGAVLDAAEVRRLADFGILAEPDEQPQA